nr:hypothetical protein [Tanacetum cinerariifolium]
MNPVATQQVALDNALIKDTDAYRFKLDNKKFRIDTEVFRENLQICPRLPNQDFVEPPSKEEMVPIIKELRHIGKCDMLSKIHTYHMHQPWRTFAAIINRCISRKSSGLDRIRPSSAQILYGMYNKKNVDFVALLWEDFMFQADNNDINYQKYGALIPKEMINQPIKDSKAYNIYLDFATGKATTKKARKFNKVASPSKKLSPVLEEGAKKPKQAKKPVKKSTTVPTTSFVIKDTYGVSVSKKKAPTKVDRGKDMDLLSDVALLEATQLKKALKKGKQETHKLYASGSGDGVGSQLKGDSEDDDSNDDDSDDVNDNDDVDSVSDGDNEASDSERTDSDEDENPNLNQNDEEEEEYEEEYVCTHDNYEFSNDDEEYEKLYKDVNMRLKDAEHEEEEGRGDAEMTDAGRYDVSQEKSYEQVEDDAHVTLNVAHVIEKTKGPMQSFFVASDFASQFLNLDNVPPVDNEVISMMNVKVRHKEPSTQAPSFLMIPSTPTPTPAPTTNITTTSIPALLDFSSLFGFDQRVFVLEKELSQLKQVDYTAQLLKTITSQISAMIDAQLSIGLEDSIQKAFRSYTAEFKKKAQGKKKRYIDLIEKSVKDIIKEEVKSQLPYILPKEVSNYATPVIQSTITESLEKVVLAKSSSQPKCTYEAAASLTEFELKKILLDKMQKNREDMDKDEDPPAGSDQGLKRRKTSKDAEPSKGFKSKESKSRSSKGTKSRPKSSRSDLGNTDDQPNVKAASEHDWFNKPERPLTPDSGWNARKFVNFGPPQTWISIIAQAKKPLLTFDELMSMPIDFSAYVMKNLKNYNLTQEHLVRPEVEECYKVVTDQLDWNNSEGQEYPFDLSKPLPLIEDRVRQVVHVGYFINNDFEYLKGGSSSSKYTTFTTKTKAAKYDDIQGIKDMVPSSYIAEFEKKTQAKKKRYVDLIKKSVKEIIKDEVKSQLP